MKKATSPELAFIAIVLTIPAIIVIALAAFLVWFISWLIGDDDMA